VIVFTKVKKTQQQISPSIKLVELDQNKNYESDRSDFKYLTYFRFWKKCRITLDLDEESITSLGHMLPDEHHSPWAACYMN